MCVCVCVCARARVLWRVGLRVRVGGVIARSGLLSRMAHGGRNGLESRPLFDTEGWFRDFEGV